jgi:DNA repair ATPase RecN
MYVNKIELKNIRGFEDLKFNLARPDGSYAGWTVFTGDNGSGKSSLLKAVAVALTGKDTARALQPSFHRWIREGATEQEGRIELTIAPQKGVDDFSGGGKTAYKNFPATIVLRNVGKETTTEVIDSQKTARRGLWSTDAHGWLWSIPACFWSIPGGDALDGRCHHRAIRHHVSGSRFAV